MAEVSPGLWGGFVIIRIRGHHPERLLNEAMEAAIPLNNIERPAQDMLVVTINARHFRRLCSLVRRRWEITIVRRLGWAFAARKLLRRKALVVGGMIALVLLYVLSSYVWFVDVRGAIEVPEKSILEAAAQAGLRPGMRKKDLVIERIEREIILTLDRLAWVNVELWGTLATVDVAERVVQEHDQALPGDVVASFDGVVEKLVILRGIPMVQEGDPVTAGQVLISGMIPPQAPEHKELTDKGEVPYIHAQGMVRARVWHEGVAEGTLERREETPTGRVHRQLLWQWGSRQGTIGSDPPFDSFSEDRRSWRLWPLPMVITLLQRFEVQTETVPLAPDLVEANVLDAAWEQVKEVLPAGAVIGTPAQVEMERFTDDGVEVIRAKVTVEAVHDIHSFRPLSAPSMAKISSGERFLQPVPGP
ncbi:MAG: sporulation protein YqfD [Firmicutes bacterium]|nr:sporulation protein YqfD [Bacillota bacterium]